MHVNFKTAKLCINNTCIYRLLQLALLLNIDHTLFQNRFIHFVTPLKQKYKFEYAYDLKTNKNLTKKTSRCELRQSSEWRLAPQDKNKARHETKDQKSNFVFYLGKRQGEIREDRHFTHSSHDKSVERFEHVCVLGFPNVRHRESSAAGAKNPQRDWWKVDHFHRTRR